MSDYLGKDTPKLGFGLMRLPRRGLRTDVGQTSRMVDMFLADGFSYFDTAYVYPGSEAAIRKALVDRYPRGRYTLATKLCAFVPLVDEQAAQRQFFTSLRRTGAGYFDYYLLHALMDNNVAKYDRYRIWQFVARQKEQGLIRHVGFSFHGGPQLLDRLLTEHPEVDFVQLQINYADWENPKVASRANYETARRHGKPIVVMEPVKGGALANPPREVRQLMDACRPGMSYASWAIRFVASLDGIITVLSGMSDVAQMADNLSYMKDFKPLDADERQVIQQAQRLLGGSAAIPCTACHYCTRGCPRQIPIPEIFAAYNLQLANGQHGQAVAAYRKAVGPGHRASDCIGCQQCEQTCPQHLPVTAYLRQCASQLESDH
mgnify:CR=1 FL=1